MLEGISQEELDAFCRCIEKISENLRAKDEMRD